jgi:hypothetical protein
LWGIILFFGDFGDGGRSIIRRYLGELREEEEGHRRPEETG